MSGQVPSFGKVFGRFARAVENGAAAVEDELTRAKSRRDDQLRSDG